MSAQEMLRRISAKTDELVAAGVIKKSKLASQIGDEEVPAAYLAHCTFARLGNVANLQKGLTGIQSSLPGQFPLVVTAAERGTCDHFDFDGAAAIVPLVSSTGHGNASINRLHYQEGKFALGTILCAVFPFDEQLVSARFLYEYLTAFKEELLVSKMIGTANVTLTLGKIADVPVPIVAPAVQKRVDELMALCDQLEAAQQERERRRDRLAAASLQRLNKPAADTNPETQCEHARFHLHNLSRLTTRPELINAMRQTIVAYAVVGRLTSTDGSLISSEAELRTVIEKKNQLGLRKKKDIVAVGKDERWCDLPNGWVWVRWDHITDWITYGFTRPMPHADAGIPILTGKNVNFGKMIFETAHMTTPDAFSELSDKDRPCVGDILVTKDGSIGRTAIVDTSEPFCINQSVAVLWLRSCHFDRRFLQLALDCPQTQLALVAKTEGVAIKHISVVDLGRMVFPLPPLAEQHRIVAKVEELMALCDQLEAQTTTTQTDSRRLLEATLKAALAPV
ncbi:MAG: restriction endonuclease subunit S [Pseudomonadota bacterium]